MAALGKLTFNFIFMNLVLQVHSNDFCTRYARRCGLGNHIVCRERVGGVMSPLLHSSITLSCPYYYSIRSASWTFTNSTGTTIQLLQQSTRGLTLNHVDKTNEGAYTCTVTLPDNSVQTENTEVFLHISGHAYFQSCAEAENGKNCTTTQHLETVVNGSVTFDTHAAYRDGGACGTKQNINFLALKKNGRNVYYCANFYGLMELTCMDNDLFYVTNRGEDKFDFDLTIKEVTLADAGEYILEFNLGDAEGYQSLSIYRKFNLRVSEMPTVSVEPSVPDSNCKGSPHQKKDVVLLFRGEVLSNNSNVSAESLGRNEDALLCIISEEHCCEDLQSSVKADFLLPNGTSIEADPTGQLYVSRGKQIVRLNSFSSSSVQNGRYCCVVSAQGKTGDPQCAQLI